MIVVLQIPDGRDWQNLPSVGGEFPTGGTRSVFRAPDGAVMPSPLTFSACVEAGWEEVQVGSEAEFLALAAP